MKKILILKKIPIYDLMDILAEVYNRGADFVDITGTSDDDRDTISIIVRDDYYSETEEPEKLTDEDLNQLL